MARLKWQTLCVMSYDNWKLSNPIDDGYVYQMVSLCCGAEILDPYSNCERTNCCYAPFIPETDICYDCKEHADIVGMICSKCGEECNEIEDYEYKQMRRDEYLENKADAKRKYNE